MSVPQLSPSDQYFGREPSTPPAIAVLSVRVGRKKSGLDYRLADDPEHILVRVVDGRVTIDTETPDELSSEKGLRCGVTELQGLARLCAAWRAERGTFAAYSGWGTSIKFWGYSQFLYYAPGRWKPTEIPREDPRLPAFQDAALHLRVREPSSAMGFDEHSPVVHDLVTGTDELVGRVVHGPGGACVVLSRGSALVSARWPRKSSAFRAVARLVVRRSHEAARAGLEHLDDATILVDPLAAAVIELAARDTGPRKI